MTRANLALYALGALVSASAGLLNIENRVCEFGLILVGLALIGVASWVTGADRPVTAAALVVVTNLAFWMAFGLWRMRPQLIGPTGSTGIDPFSLVVSVWLIVFIGCMVYESIVLIRGLGDRPQRQISVIGLLGVVLQVPITIRFIYVMIQGI